MNINEAESYAKGILSSEEFNDKKDSLDKYRHIVLFLAEDILTDVKEYKNLNKFWQFKMRSGILGQINKWTIPQIIEFKRKIDRYVKEKWVD